MRRPVLIAHAEGDEAHAAALADRITAAGYEAVHHGSVLVGDSLHEAATQVLVAGGPVVLCGTIRAMGTTWAQQVVNAARAYAGVRIYGVQIERQANLGYLTFDSKLAEYWRDPQLALTELITALTTHYPPQVTPATLAADTAELAEHRFRDLLLDACDIIDLANLPADRQLATRQLMLRSLFVPLKVQVEREAGQDIAPETPAALEHRRGATPGKDETVAVSAPVAVKPMPVGVRLGQSRRLVVLGDPGSGKTTTLRWMATAYLLRLRGDPDWQALPAVDTLPDEDWLPILIRCRDLGPAQVAGTLEDMLVHVLRRQELTTAEVEALKKTINRRLDDGTALLLIDGLDEITDPGARARFCRQLEQIHLARPNAPFVATSRIVGYREMGYRIGRGFEHVSITDLDHADKDDFVRRWCAVTEPPNRQQTVTAELTADIHGTDRIERLTANPMLLTTMALVKRKVGKLPEHRADLYREAVQVLLNWRAEVDEPIDHYEAVPQLEYVAYAMSDRGVQQITDEEIVELLEQMRAAYPNVHAIHLHPPREFIRLLERRTGILVESGHVRRPSRLAPVFEFRHLTFQEYLTALALVDGHFPDRDRDKSLAENIAPLAARVDDDHKVTDSWQESVRLCVTICHTDDVDSVLAAVLEPEPGDDAETRAALAGRCLEDEPNAGDEIVDTILRRLVDAVHPDQEGAPADKAILVLARGRWAPRVRDRMAERLWALGEDAIPWLGRLYGQVAAPEGVGVEAGSGWTSTTIAALEQSGGPGLLRAVLAIGSTADRSAIARTDAADRLIGLLHGDDALLAGAAAWALGRMAKGAGPKTWYPDATQAARIRNAGHSRAPDSRILSLMTAVGARAWGPDLGPLVAAARSADRMVRVAAAALLGETERAAARDPLLLLLEDSEPQVRAAAARATRKSSDPAFRSSLLSHLADPAVPVRSAVAQTLRDSGGYQAVEPLIAAFTDDPSREVRDTSALTLGSIGDSRAVEPALAALAALTTGNRDRSWADPALIGALGDSRGVEPVAERLPGSIGNNYWLSKALEDLEDHRGRPPLLAALTTGVPVWKAARALGKLGDRRDFEVILGALVEGNQVAQTAAVDGLEGLGDERALPVLITLLADPSAEVRAAVARAIGSFRDVRSLAPLIRLAHDSATPVRAVAAQSLGRIDDHNAIGPLTALLVDDDEEVRAVAAAALGEAKGPPSVESVLSAVADPALKVRGFAVQALANLNDERVLPAARHLLSDPAPEVRANAVGALSILGDDESLPVVIDQLTAATENGRVWAAFGLSKFDDPRAVEPLVGALADQNPQVRRWAARALGNFHGDRVIDALLERTTDDHADVRQDAVWALGLQGDPRANPVLLAMLTDRNPKVRARSAEALGRLLCSEAVDALVASLDDTHPAVRAMTAQSLGILNDDRAVPALIVLLADPHPAACVAALNSLGILRAEPAMEKCVALLDSPVSVIRKHALPAVVRLTGDQARERIFDAMHDPHPKVRGSAIWELRHIARGDGEKQLLAALEDPAHGVRAAAALAIGSARAEAGVGQLIRLLDDPSLVVQGRAAMALGRIGSSEALVPLRRAATSDPFRTRVFATLGIARLGVREELSVVRGRLEAVHPRTRQYSAAVLNQLGDPDARAAIGDGFASVNRQVRVDWMRIATGMLSDQLDVGLLSRNGDSRPPFLDPRRPVGEDQVTRAARLLHRPALEIRERYERLAAQFPLSLSWRE